MKNTQFRSYLNTFCLFVLFWIVLNTSTLAQPGLHIEGNQTVLFGRDTTGSGTKFFWLPSKQAFRAGYTGGNIWDPDSIGVRSFALGNSTHAKGIDSGSWGSNNRAIGKFSTAWGFFTKATKEGSTAWGYANEAGGEYSTAIGLYNKALGRRSMVWGAENEAIGDHSTSWGYSNKATGATSTVWGNYNFAEGAHSTSWGQSNKAIGNESTSFGIDTEASGSGATSWGVFCEAQANFATAWGNNNKAIGETSTVWGLQNYAQGNSATAWGKGNKAQSYLQTVLGQYADTLSHSNPSSWDPNDYLLVVGNGLSNGNRSNALALYKSGDIYLDRDLTVSRDAYITRKLTLFGYDSPWGIDTDDCVISADPGITHSDLILVANDVVSINLDDDNNGFSEFHVLNGSDTKIFALEEDGDLTITGDLYAPNLNFGDYANMQYNTSNGQFYYDNSSVRHKKNIQDLKDDFSKILLANPKIYSRPGNADRTEIGYIAEDMEGIGLNHLIGFDKEGKVENFNYEKMILYVVEVLKKQQNEMDKMKAEIRLLKENQISDP